MRSHTSLYVGVYRWIASLEIRTKILIKIFNYPQNSYRACSLNKPCAIIWLHPIDLEGLLIFRIFGQILLGQFLFDGLFVLGVHQRYHGPLEARA